jgi:hypothetical protein
MGRGFPEINYGIPGESFCYDVDLKWNSMRIPCGIEKKLIWNFFRIILELLKNSFGSLWGTVWELIGN